jgi:hypothetical protein
MGEIISGMKGGVTPFTEDVFNLISQGFSDEDPEVRSNAAFAMGVLIENSEMDISGHYLTILTALRPYFVVAEGAPHAQFNAKDNATGCVARMLLKNSSSMPLDQVSYQLYSRVLCLTRLGYSCLCWSTAAQT